MDFIYKSNYANFSLSLEKENSNLDKDCSISVFRWGSEIIWKSVSPFSFLYLK